MKEPSSSVSEEMVDSYILYISRSLTKCIHFSLICTPQTASDISLKSALENLMKESSSSVSEEMVDSYILYISRSLTKCIHFSLICTPQTVSDISLKSALENLMKEPSSSVSEEMVDSYILYISRSLTKCLHFSLICTPQTASDISLKSALENLMKESSSFMNKVSSAGSVERKVDSTI